MGFFEQETSCTTALLDHERNRTRACTMYWHRSTVLFESEPCIIAPPLQVQASARFSVGVLSAYQVAEWDRMISWLGLGLGVWCASNALSPAIEIWIH